MARKDPMIFQSLVMMSDDKIEIHRKKIKKQLIEGVVLLPCYMQLVTPQEPKTGKVGYWNEDYICSLCGCKVYPVDIDNGSFNYCPNCGAKMEEEKDARKDQCKDG